MRLPGLQMACLLRVLWLSPSRYLPELKGCLYVPLVGAAPKIDFSCETEVGVGFCKTQCSSIRQPCATICMTAVTAATTSAAGMPLLWLQPLNRCCSGFVYWVHQCHCSLVTNIPGMTSHMAHPWLTRLRTGLLTPKYAYLYVFAWHDQVVYCAGLTYCGSCTAILVLIGARNDCA
jgi:hypothetical protein